CAVDGLDVVILGLNDLATSCGLPGEVRHARVAEAAERVLRAAAERGVAGGAAGFYERTYEEPRVAELARRGARFLQLFGDAGPQRDLNVLVVVLNLDDAHGTRDALWHAVGGTQPSVEIWPATVDDVERTGDSIGSFIYPILREGKVIYGVDERDAQAWLR